MKIGIMTFHWAANHGAIIQAYALMTFLKKSIPEADVRVIDYYPERFDKTFKKVFKYPRPAAILENYKEYKKEKVLSPFRERLLKTERFYSTRELIEKVTDFDVLICGSDQIWNEAYTLYGEGKPTTAYYLPFCDKANKIAYSVSFGSERIKNEVKDIIAGLLKEFKAISARENSGVQIVKELGQECVLTCDPTLLLQRSDYEFISDNSIEQNYVVKYILRRQKKDVSRLITGVLSYVSRGKKVFDIEMNNIPNWLGKIRNADFCVTNSFHGTVFSIIFHTPFVVIMENSELSGMNDRLKTLLTQVGLEDRIISNYAEISKISNSKIDWDVVDFKLKGFSDISKGFLMKNCCFNGEDD